MRNIFRMRWPTNFKLGTPTEHEDPDHQQARDLQGQRSRSQGHKVTWCVWLVLADKSRTKRTRNTKIGRRVAHPTGNNVHQFQGQRLKVKVSRPSNAHTVNAQHLLKWKAYKLETCYTDRVRRPASPTTAVTSKVKGQGRKVTWCV